jgi:hypothetical protein
MNPAARMAKMDLQVQPRTLETWRSQVLTRRPMERSTERPIILMARLKITTTLRLDKRGKRPPRRGLAGFQNHK